MSHAPKLYYDSETCGLHSMPVLLQYKAEGGQIVLYNVWLETVGKTLDLIEWMMTHTIVGFNLSFDHFHLVKLYTIWRLLPRDWIPVEHIDEIAMIEPQGQDGPCLKPAGALDLLLHSRKGPYQALMSHEDIRIRRVPTALAYALADELEQRIQLDGILFAKRQDPAAPKWHVFDVKTKDGEINQHFKDVVLKFAPAGGLKFLAEYAMKLKTPFHFKDVEPDTKYRPVELGYAPTALAISSPEKNWEAAWDDDGNPTKFAWPGVIKYHIEHWANNADAREYARLDVVYTEKLDEHFGFPSPNDDDSVLACMVPVVRWHGFEIDVPGIKKLLEGAQAKINNSPVNVNKPAEVRRYLSECMDDVEQLAISETTRKAKLTAVSGWEVHEESDLEQEVESWRVEGEACLKCLGSGCERCEGGVLKAGRHPAAVRASEILSVKAAVKEKELFEKLLKAGKFHADFNVIGTLSSRMSGASGLNAQGINHAVDVRKMFPLAGEGYELSLGDFKSFEVCLAAAVYNDPNLNEVILSGQKIHAYFAMEMYPGKTYEEILASEGSDFDMYTRGKSGVFGLIYGGDWNTLVRNFGIDPEVAKRAELGFFKRFPGIPKARQKTFDMFCSMTQPAGIGSAVVWREPSEYVESFLGFRRYFTVHNLIAKALFQLAQAVPKAWKDCKVKVIRDHNRGRVQTAGGAVSSALYGAAFGMQSNNKRAAANHEIQSPGGQICKSVQRRVWDLQPAGIHPLYVAPANVHDEILCVHTPEYRQKVADTIKAGVESFRDRVPLIGMDWVQDAASWADKKGKKASLSLAA